MINSKYSRARTDWDYMCCVPEIKVVIGHWFIAILVLEIRDRVVRFPRLVCSPSVLLQ